MRSENELYLKALNVTYYSNNSSHLFDLISTVSLKDSCLIAGSVNFEPLILIYGTEFENMDANRTN